MIALNSYHTFLSKMHKKGTHLLFRPFPTL
nr:MAG TPA: hypothetical protein [Caudoviricetes sp.]DAM09058.1 MAG TPA: hypothetical protein [Caudoviricetes sp.]DAZ63484.1 MAG TPA: hypothetical protein [Caudoviricetes sp.]